MTKFLNVFLPKQYTSDHHQLFRNTKTQQTTNTYGKNILELCIGSQLRILNGRTIGDSSGKATYFNYNGVTINDYYLCSSSFIENVTNFKVGDFIPNLSDHCPITINILSKFQSSYEENILRPRPVRLKWSKLAEEQFIFHLHNSDFTDKVNTCKEKIHLHNVHVSSLMDISSDVNDIVEKCSCLIKNASFGVSVRLNPRVHQKKKRKHNKVWHDNECKIKLRHVKSLGRILIKSPWNKNLRLKVLYEKRQYNKILR